MRQTAPVILASASTARRDILAGAGLDFQVDPATIDEPGFKLRNGSLNAPDMAAALAIEKGRVISKKHPGVMTVGADQTMECEGVCYDKPVDMDAARGHLQKLRGRIHILHSAVCVVRDDEVLWSTVENAHMSMRDFDDVFLEEYLKQAGPSLLSSVGCYRLETRGAHLFTHVDGDFFTILGLPLLPLLEFFRKVEILH